MATINKTAAERYSIAMDYTSRLPAGATVASSTVVATDSSSNDDTVSVLLSGTATIDSAEDTASVKLIAGADADTYTLTFTTTLSNSDILEDDVTLIISA